MLLTYEYYKDTYGGTLVSQEKFNSYNIRANSIFNNYVNLKYLDNVLNSFMKDSVYIALCELVDNLARYDKLLDASYESDLIGLSGIASETTKDHTVSFKSKDKASSHAVEEQLDMSNIGIMRKHLSTTGLLYRGL